MIGWYCNTGYFQGDKSTINNLSQFTFLDNNVPFVIPIIQEFPPKEALNVTYPRDGYGSNDLHDIYEFINKYVGPDWYLVYGTLAAGYYPYNDNQNTVEELLNIMTEMAPGWDKAWSKMNEFIKSLTTNDNVCYCIYIPNLKRVLLYKEPSHLACMMKVNEDGTFSRISGFPNVDISFFDAHMSISGLNSAYISSVPALKIPYTSYDVLKEAGSYMWLGITYDEYNKTHRYVISDFSGAYNSISAVTYLFTEGEKPDFEGGEPPEPPPENPFGPGGTSKPGDLPPGTFDDNSDPIPDSQLPSISAANTGFTRIYNPTLQQVQDLAKYLWTDTSVIETIWNHIKQFFENPMEAIIGFNLVPVPVPDGGTKNFALMYIDTGVQMTTAANQFVDQDCGTVKLERYYGSALDQSPYTRVTCFLPYIGMVHLNTDEVMGTTLQVKYRIDIVSGSCVAKILVDGNVLYQYSGHCAINIPISSADFSSYVSAAISVAKLAVGAAIGAGQGALAAVGEAEAVAQQTNQVMTKTTTTTETERNYITATRSTVETIEKPRDVSSTRASFDGISPRNIANTVGQIMSSKPQIEHSGSFSGNTGYLGVRRPFIIIERPNMCLPENYQLLNGFPAMITMTLGECVGFTKIQQVQLTGMTATNPEQAEILNLLKQGVVF